MMSERDGGFIRGWWKVRALWMSETGFSEGWSRKERQRTIRLLCSMV